MTITRVKRGDAVLITIGDDEYEARVIDPLASQFTCRILRQKQVRFYFYADKGVTWKPLI